MRRKTVGILFTLMLMASLVLTITPVARIGATTNSQIMSGNYFNTANFEEAPPAECYLIISSTEGGSVTDPGEGVFSYDEGAIIYLAAAPDTGYRFDRWTGNVSTIANIESVATTIIMNDNYSITAKFKAVGLSSIPDPLAIGLCFIATAAYGTPRAEQIDLLRKFRDVALLESPVGSQFVALYYQLSPPVAEFIAGNELVRTLVRELVVDPIVWVIRATENMWQN